MTKDSGLYATRQAGLNGGARGNLLRLPILVLGLAACFYGIWSSGREGVAQLLAGYGLMTGRLEETEQAVRLNPSLPESHYVRASLLSGRGDFALAVSEYERATALRPRDYALWLELGRAREQAGDVEGALAAFGESVRLAPFYAQPRWELGNTLYRAGRLDEALRELRRASSSDPRLLPQALELSWAALGNNAQALVQAIQPRSATEHLALARFLVERGKISEALSQFREAGSLADNERRALVRQLLDARYFAEAYEVWSSGRQAREGATSRERAVIINGGFEEPVSLDEPGFGWQLPQGMQGVRTAQDTAAPREGRQSLQLTWSGNPDVNSAAISQLVLVSPNSRYELRFAARTEKLVTGGLPQVTLTDPASADARPLGKPVTLPQGSGPWQDYATEFETGKSTGAVLISLRRESCSSNPCPIFGRLWLDDFSLRKIP